MKRLRVWTCSFEGHYPVGTAAVVIACTAKEAAGFIEKELEAQGLPQSILASDMKNIKLKDGNAIILNDGNY